ncbi:thiolase family protein [Sporosarcina highlanderae]|uniref:acetyl-CoA C-acetyltransferase n=1 Tax=Sporosarcina highlanderae TaxID=3035916 RepID=A0ABT8JSN5_9BACL|nr:thiolase family protein [Sporosarcina highlanderae]MDN4608163.1 thiolase family protein [Sporosarcina highlanderae]
MSKLKSIGMKDAVIVGVSRTPIGKMRGTLSSFSAVKLGAMVMRNVIEDKVNPEDIDEIIMGNLFDSQSFNFARVAALEAGFPIEVPAITIDRQCASSLNAVAWAAMLVSSGQCEVVLAGGVESHSNKPFYVKSPEKSYPDKLEFLSGQTTNEEYGNPSMIATAENLAKMYNITRQECDEFALMSHRKAEAAWQRGFYDDETFPIHIPQRKGEPLEFRKDEGIRADTNLDALSRLKPVMDEDGVVTAGNASPLNDGASAILIMSREKAEEYGLKPLAKIGAFASSGVDPSIMGIGPVYSTRKLLKNTGLSIDDFDVIEINEAFAAQSLACIRELGIDMKKVNPNGGAIAIGHPNAASGGILVARTAREMVEKDLTRGLITFCVGGGQGFSLILERG